MSRVRALPFHGVPGKMTRRLAGVVIGTQGLAVFFGALVARALAAAQGSPTSNTFLLFGSLLAALCILDAGLQRRPWGVTLGWVLQIATFACAFVVPMMLLVGLLFGGLWVTALVQGRRMDDHTERVDAQCHAAQEASASDRPASEAPASAPGSKAPASAPVSEAPASETPAEGRSMRDG